MASNLLLTVPPYRRTPTPYSPTLKHNSVSSNCRLLRARALLGRKLRHPRRTTYLALASVDPTCRTSHSILIDGQALSTRKNLFQFLEQYRKREDPAVYLWIDQITIDQSNTSERNAQV
jgi:hypothetical protein